MLIVRFCGGLGNQMFEYAFCVKLRQTFPQCVIKTDVRDFRVTKYHHGYELGRIFRQRQVFEEAGWREVKQLTGELPIVIGWPASKITEPIRKAVNAFLYSAKTDCILEEKDVDIWNLKEVYEQRFSEKNVYFHGCWTGINKYLNEMDVLKRDFRFPAFSDLQNQRTQEAMEGTESVSVHIRRGDYQGTVFDILTLDYYKKAIELIMSRVSCPQFYFFSDDVEYVNKNFSFLPDKKVVNWNRDNDSWKDMQLMTCCRHNIIANSTFSQWGALLNNYRNKMVIYPGKEKKNVSMEYVQLPGWYRIEV